MRLFNERIHLILSALALVCLCAGCTPKAWNTHPMPVPPDQSCRTGACAGYDVWIWDCIQNRRVVVYQFCGSFTGCNRAEREEVACGERSPFEIARARELSPCHQVPPGRSWR